MVFALTISLLVYLFGAPNMLTTLTNVILVFHFLLLLIIFFWLTCWLLSPQTLSILYVLFHDLIAFYYLLIGSLPHFSSLVVFVWSVFLYLVLLLPFVSIALVSCCLLLYCHLSDILSFNLFTLTGIVKWN